MNKIIFTLGLLFFCLACQTKADDNDESEHPALISVTGSGQVNVQPTEAVVSIGVEKRNPSVQTVRMEVDEITSNIIVYLKEQQIADEDIQTSYLTIYPYYSDNDNSQNVVPDYYVGQKGMTFVLKDLTNYDNIMSGLYDLGLNRVDGVIFTTPNQNDNAIEAKRRAVANARETASAIAGELGVSLGAVSSVSDASYGVPVFTTAALAEDSSAGAGSGPSISGGSLTYGASITVAFEIDQ